MKTQRLILRVTAKGFVAASTQVGSATTSPFIAVVFEDADLTIAERLMIQPTSSHCFDLASQIIRKTPDSASPVRPSEPVFGVTCQPSVESADILCGFTVGDVMSHGAVCITESETCFAASEKMLQV